MTFVVWKSLQADKLFLLCFLSLKLVQLKKKGGITVTS